MGRTLIMVLGSSLLLLSCGSEPKGGAIDDDNDEVEADGGDDGNREQDGAAGSASSDAGGVADGGATSSADGGTSSRRDGGTSGGDAGMGTRDGGMTTTPATPTGPAYKLDCGASGIVLEAAGNPKNRVNYIIVGDGYTEAEMSTTYMKHLTEMLRVRFLPAAEPYPRYRKFINICALKTPSPNSGITETRGDSAFGGYGNDESRLGYIQDDKVRAAITKLLPKEIEVDWTGVVMNDDRWWNAGGRFMVWSGGNKDAGLAAMHEGGHSYQLLADEYGGNCTFSGDEKSMRINVTKDMANTAGKWSKWFDFTQMPGTGKQGVFEGAQYCDKGAWRPTQDSVMNSLWRSSYFNAISLEQAVRLIYGMVKPIDSATPADTTTPGVFTVEVVDPAVIKVDWYVDDMLKAMAGGGSFDVGPQKLSSGMHTIRARAYDDTPWVRGDKKELEQSISWTVQVP
jgi:IgA Peptidase M64